MEMDLDLFDRMLEARDEPRLRGVARHPRVQAVAVAAAVLLAPAARASAQDTCAGIAHPCGPEEPAPTRGQGIEEAPEERGEHGTLTPDDEVRVAETGDDQPESPEDAAQDDVPDEADFMALPRPLAEEAEVPHPDEEPTPEPIVHVASETRDDDDCSENGDTTAEEDEAGSYASSEWDDDLTSVDLPDFPNMAWSGQDADEHDEDHEHADEHEREEGAEDGVGRFEQDDDWESVDLPDLPELQWSGEDDGEDEGEDDSDAAEEDEEDEDEDEDSGADLDRPEGGDAGDAIVVDGGVAIGSDGGGAVVVVIDGVVAVGADGEDGGRAVVISRGSPDATRLDVDDLVDELDLRRLTAEISAYAAEISESSGWSYEVAGEAGTVDLEPTYA